MIAARLGNYLDSIGSSELAPRGEQYRSILPTSPLRVPDALMQIHSRPPTDSMNARHPNRHVLAWKALKVLLVPATIYMLWKAASVISDSHYPIVVVISESMEPAFSRGDLLLLSNRKHFVEVGDIPVCWFHGKPLPMVHRAIAVTYTESLSETKPVV